MNEGLKGLRSNGCSTQNRAKKGEYGHKYRGLYWRCCSRGDNCGKHIRGVLEAIGIIIGQHDQNSGDQQDKSVGHRPARRI